MVGPGSIAATRGTDRVVVAEPGTRGVDELIADGVRGELYAHELFTVRPGQAPELLDAVAAEARPAYESLGLTHVGRYRVAMVNDSEALALWAVRRGRRGPRWSGPARPVGGPGRMAGGGDGPRRRLAAAAPGRRPLSPLRIGRQPAVTDRRPLDEIR